MTKIMDQQMPTDGEDLMRQTPDSPRRLGIVGRLAQALREQNWFAFALEVAIVVTGVFLGMQANIWNEQRKVDERFRLGIRELYPEILAAAFLEESLEDKLSAQLVLIDSLLQYPQAVDPRRLPAIIHLLDDYVFTDYAFNREGIAWKADFLEVDAQDLHRVQLAQELRTYLLGNDLWAQAREDFGLTALMTNHLRARGIPVRFYVGQSYAQYVTYNAGAGYTPAQLVRVSALLKEETFVADLMNVRWEKETMLSYAGRGLTRANEIWAAMKRCDPSFDFSIQHLEIVGPGVAGGDWYTGQAMRRVQPDDDLVWEREVDLVAGEVKFRTDAKWSMDWGQGELDAERLVFRGGNITAPAGRYRVRVDLRAREVGLVKR